MRNYIAEFTLHQTNEQTMWSSAKFGTDRLLQRSFLFFFISYLVLVLREKLNASLIYYGRFYGKIIQEKRLRKNETFDLVYLSKRSNSLRRQ